MVDLMRLMFRLEGLKQIARTGWNIKFPEGHRFKTRNVEGAESVADHSWGVAVLALLAAQYFRLDALKMVWMALIHDVAEIITLDIVTATLMDPEERRLAIEEKKRLEDQSMREIFLPMGKWGWQCYGLWLEYENQTSQEAVILKQLDKLETSMQALLYQEQGHELDPNEFFNHADDCISDPRIIEMMSVIRERAAG